MNCKIYQFNATNWNSITHSEIFLTYNLKLVNNHKIVWPWTVMPIQFEALWSDLIV